MEFKDRLKIAIDNSLISGSIATAYSIGKNTPVSRQSVENYLKGKQQPTIEGATIIAECLNVNINWLIKGVGVMRDKNQLIQEILTGSRYLFDNIQDKAELVGYPELKIKKMVDSAAFKLVIRMCNELAPLIKATKFPENMGNSLNYAVFIYEFVDGLKKIDVSNEEKEIDNAQATKDIIERLDRLTEMVSSQQRTIESQQRTIEFLAKKQTVSQSDIAETA